ncbi:hypothetical protein GCM10015535_52090 [Streptomyces gelaticus]|uniref:Uncharacterized protein n=1 Tax=Streptomyces gelaticus TaxID=285446 RepID=A0ABQ2W855_9ACTN|nr:hypothetical protein GCM10015535_52090 [Streptomyces gelaticus]
MRPGDDAQLDAQIVLEELHRVGAVGHDPADLGGGQHHGVRSDLAEKRLGPRGVAEIEVCAIAGDHLVLLGGETTHQRRADQAAVARDEDTGTGSQKRADGFLGRAGEISRHGPDSASSRSPW